MQVSFYVLFNFELLKVYTEVEVECAIATRVVIVVADVG